MVTLSVVDLLEPVEVDEDHGTPTAEGELYLCLIKRGRGVRESRFADAFAGGTFVHYMLPPWADHRFHVSVSGRVEESFVSQGTVADGEGLTSGHSLSGRSTFMVVAVLAVTDRGRRPCAVGRSGYSSSWV
ncbi:hypothetical protein V3N99_19765 [Dermatophilaceae bacterium Soc4.6]